ncbi:MAG: hypothetical protein HQK76_00325 [Desulfobacterales bacterium]|nr:hypothetical protein [Desulfobacterales bacterium]
MKNALRILAVLTIVFCMAMPSMADTVCKKCKMQPIFIDSCLAQQGNCAPFDYENNGGKAVIKVCDCPKQEYFDGNQTTYQTLNATTDIIGVQLTILTEGIYWSAGNVSLGAYSLLTNDETPAVPVYTDGVCTTGVGTTYGAFDHNKDGIRDFPAAYQNVVIQRDLVNGQPVLNWNTLIPAIQANANLNGRNTVSYQYYNTRGVQNQTKPIDPAIYQTQCIVKSTDNNKVNRVRIKNAYAIDKSLDIDFKLVYWWVGMPNMVADRDERKLNDLVQVKIELLNDEAATGVCADCISICECTVDVGTLTCGGNQMYFPYVITSSASTSDSANWATGIAITNVASATTSPTNLMNVTFTLTDSTGAQFQKILTAGSISKRILIYNVEAMCKEFGWAPTGAAWLLVNSNFAMDGYQFNLCFDPAMTFGAGVLPRLQQRYFNGATMSTQYN